ncbi:ZIP family metal transporter [Pigmentiphaga litoralis]|uniref:Zinc and cadmium transporter n=1 Tax=Pigmentiphaga litoralis TaxID=516702 RepID=A0A7Y9IZT2_9BURK|nr:ZIP family metal transporter [Pigmentiphaga litoralis]NYE26720.1 zinc and cadmium transporter [Pigmentiphaga litoralis]NYE85870.1 zinc and cadmium transporter [Pigmentiphaga litoralis]
MTLVYIVLATLVSGVVSALVAGWLGFRYFSRYLHEMVSFSVGVLLSVALLHTLPEAFESEADTRTLFALLLGGLLIFFMLEKVALLRHNHHHEHDGHHHPAGHDAHEAGRGGMAVLVGDGLHNFCDGILVAAAFLADPKLGVLTALSIAAHEVPQELGDFIILVNAGLTRKRALLFNVLSSMMAILGGVLGYFLLEGSQALLPYVLVVAASSFIYIAVADLMPQMQKRTSLRDSLPQFVLVGAGVAIVYTLTVVFHAH